MAEDAQQNRSTGGLKEKHLTFSLAGEDYALSIQSVREIVGLLDVTMVPNTPEFVLGVVNLRGKIIPVIDLRIKFGMPPGVRSEENCTIVVETANAETGVLVDKVAEVVDISPEQVEPAPQMGIDLDTRFLKGVGKIEGSVQLILDIDEVLTDLNIPLGNGDEGADNG